MTPVPHKHATIIHAYADGAEVQWKNATGNWITPAFPDFDPEAEYRIRPEDPPYPETLMPMHELKSAYSSDESDNFSQALLNVANAAIKHAVQTGQVAIANAIRDGQVVVPTDHEVTPDRLTQYSTHIINQGRIFGTKKVVDYVSNRLLDAPDMVPATMLDRVARAVYLACDSIMVDMYNDTALQGIDLTAIIASVKAGAA